MPLTPATLIREVGAPVDDRPDNTGALVIVAAHDEAPRIGATLAALRRTLPGASVWVADDGSRDDTARIAAAAGARVVRGERRIGKGGAMTRAVRAALAGAAADDADVDEEAVSDAGVVLLCDGDLGESAARLAALVQAVLAGAEGGEGRTDLAVAAFARRAGGGFGLALGFGRWAIRRRCGLVATAPLSGQRALRADALSRLLPFAPGYGMEVGMTIDAVRAGMRVQEMELDLEHRVSGRAPGGFAHRARQLLDVVRAYAARR
jgi:glycosyltransferase involved in cell wall biosynthesis